MITLIHYLTFRHFLKTEYNRTTFWERQELIETYRENQKITLALDIILFLWFIIATCYFVLS